MAGVGLVGLVGVGGSCGSNNPKVFGNTSLIDAASTGDFIKNMHI